MTQDRLAELIGTATRNVQRLEAGQNVTLHTLARLALALEVSAAELVGVDPIRPAPARRYPAPGTSVQAVGEKRGARRRKTP